MFNKEELMPIVNTAKLLEDQMRIFKGLDEIIDTNDDSAGFFASGYAVGIQETLLAIQEHVRKALETCTIKGTLEFCHTPQVTLEDKIVPGKITLTITQTIA